MDLAIRPATASDHDAIWGILEPVIRAGETYTLPRDLDRTNALDYWFAKGHAVFVAHHSGQIAGTYFLCANQQGGGAHVANCGFMTAPALTGRGIARGMCIHALGYAKSRGFLAMQFNFVVGTNTRAIQLWTRLGFETVGRLPGAFAHPTLGLVDALVMYRVL